MYIVIIGCGRTGSSLASLLSKEGHEVVVIDNNSKQFGKLSIDFSGFKVDGDALEHDILKKAKTDKADMVVITTGSDKINYMVTQMSRELFKVKSILVRVIDPDKQELFTDFSEVETFSPIELLVEAFLDRIESNYN